MTTVEIRKYQKCEFCHNTCEVEDQLRTVTLPVPFNQRLKMQRLSICETCIVKLHDIIKSNLLLEEIEYAGVTCQWLI